MSIKEQLEQLEKEIAIYYKEVNNPTLPTQEGGIVFFKFLYELVEYATLLSLVDDFVPNKNTEILVASELKNIKNYVSIKDGKVVVSPEYLELIKPSLNNDK